MSPDWSDCYHSQIHSKAVLTTEVQSNPTPPKREKKKQREENKIVCFHSVGQTNHANLSQPCILNSSISCISQYYIFLFSKTRKSKKRNEE